MYWIGVSPEPLNRSHLIPDKLDDVSIRMAAKVLSRAINDALSPNIKARALEIAERISLEVMHVLQLFDHIAGEVFKGIYSGFYTKIFLLVFYATIIHLLKTFTSQWSHGSFFSFSFLPPQSYALTLYNGLQKPSFLTAHMLRILVCSYEDSF